jgi:hypothetical protein
VICNIFFTRSGNLMNHCAHWIIRDGKGHVMSNVAVLLSLIVLMIFRSSICFLFASSLEGSGGGVLLSSSRANSSMTR